MLAGLLAPGARASRCSVTSRRRLGLGTEWLVEVPGLPYPPAGADAEAAGYPAVRLFEDRARLLRPGFGPAADLAAVGRVCRLVDGVPLAIELAARWVRSASPAAIADRLAAGTELLETTAPDVEPRHRSIRVGDRLVLGAARRRASGGRWDASRSCGAASTWTRPPPWPGPGCRCWPAWSTSPWSRWARTGATACTSCCASTPPSALPRTPPSRPRCGAATPPTSPRCSPARPARRSRAELDADVENLRAATDWLVEHADPADLDAPPQRLWQLYRRRGWFREAQAVLGAALRRREVPAPARARWHRLLGEAHQQLGEMPQARDHLERTLALLGSPLPSRPGWLGMLASQALQRALRRLRPGGPAERDQRRRDRAAEPAAVCWQLQEAYWMLEDQTPLVPLALWA